MLIHMCIYKYIRIYTVDIMYILEVYVKITVEVNSNQSSPVLLQDQVKSGLERLDAGGLHAIAAVRTHCVVRVDAARHDADIKVVPWTSVTVRTAAQTRHCHVVRLELAVSRRLLDGEQSAWLFALATNFRLRGAGKAELIAEA